MNNSAQAFALFYFNFINCVILSAVIFGIGVAFWTKISKYLATRPNCRVIQDVYCDYVPQYRTGLFWRNYVYSNSTHVTFTEFNLANQYCVKHFPDVIKKQSKFKTVYFKITK